MDFNEYQVAAAKYDLSDKTNDLRATGFIENSPMPIPGNETVTIIILLYF